MSENVGHCKYCGGDRWSHSGSCPTLDGAGLLAQRDSLALHLQSAQAALAHVMAENTAKTELLTRIRQWDAANQPPGGGDGAYWASEIDALFAKLAEQEWGDDDPAHDLLLDAYYQLDPIYLADGVTLHPGCVSTLHDLYAYLWPNGKPANAERR